MAFGGLGVHNAPHTQGTGTAKPTGSKPTPAAAKTKPKVAAAPGRVSRLLANAGERAKLPDSYLSTSQLAQRNLNRRLAAPVTPGSSMTQRDLARQTGAAADVRYGAATQQAQQNVQQLGQVQRDTSDYYDAYLKELAAHQQNVAGFQQQAQQGVAGLSQAQSALPAQGAATGLSGENQAVASQASAVRKALTDSFGAMLTAQGANANTYADSLAKVVGPGAKVQALGVAQGNVGKARQQLEQLAADRGAFRQQLAGQTTQDEAKNVLAEKLATGKSTLDTAQLGETIRAHKASEKNSAAATTARQQAAAGKTNSHGYTAAQWDAMTVERRRQIIAQDRKSGGTDAKTGTFEQRYGVKPQSTAGYAGAQNALAVARRYAQALKAGAAKASTTLDYKSLRGILELGQPSQKVDGKTSPAIPKQDTIWAAVAADEAFNGGVISAKTAQQLHKAGYTVRQLGLTVKPNPAPEHP